MKYLKILIIIFFLAIALCSIQVSALQVTISNATISANTGQVISVPITITNDLPEIIFNVSLDENQYFTMAKIIQLEPNQSVTHSLNFTSENPINQNFQLNFFLLRKTTTYQTPVSVPINILDSGFSPSSTVLYKGDTMVYSNKGSFVRDINCSRFNAHLDLNASFSHVFDTISNYTVNDLTFGYIQNIYVLDNLVTSYYRTPSLDKQITFYLNIAFKNVALSVSILETSYNLSENSNTMGVLTLKNLGSEIARNITLTGEWSIFSRNTFNINPEEKTYVTFIILPKDIYTNNTNKSYIKSIVISGLNINNYYLNYSVFVPANYNATNIFENVSYSDIDSLLSRLEAALELLRGKIIYKDKIVYKEPEVSVNYSASEIAAWNTRFAKCQTDMQICQQTNLQIMLAQNESSSRCFEMCNQSFDLSKKTSEDMKKSWDVSKLIIIIFCSLVMIISTIFITFKLISRKNNR